jgi:hypothetical protein
VWIPFVLSARPTYFRRKIRESDVSEHLFPCLTYPLDLRETANHLASSIWCLRKCNCFAPSYFYVNARRARYDYLLRQGTWNMFFGVGKTATSILNEAAARRNEEFNNTREVAISSVAVPVFRASVASRSSPNIS